MFSRNVTALNLLRWLLLPGIMLAGSGCTPAASQVPTLPATVVSFPCGDLHSASSEFLCVEVNDQDYLIQAGTAQVTFTFNGGNITLQGTLIVNQTQERILFSMLDGSAALGIPGRIHMLAAGEAIAVSRHDDAVQVSIAAVNVGYLRGLRLPETVTQFITEQFSTMAAVNGAGCIPDTWRQEYRVQRGDTLSGIAQNFNVSSAAIQEMNCIADPQRLEVGSNLYIPYPETQP